MKEIVKKHVVKVSVANGALGVVKGKVTDAYVKASTGKTQEHIDKKRKDAKQRSNDFRALIVQATRTKIQSNAIIQPFQHTKALLGFESQLAIIRVGQKFKLYQPSYDF